MLVDVDVSAALRRHKISVRPVDDLMGTKFADLSSFDHQRLVSLVSREMHGPYKNYAAASDIIRYAGLHRFGGLYFDLDFHPFGNDNSYAGRVARLKSPSMKRNPFHQQLNNGHQLALPAYTREFFNNSIVAMTAGERLKGPSLRGIVSSNVC